MAACYARTGAAVTIIDRDTERAVDLCADIRAHGGTATFVSANLARTEDIQAVLRQLAGLPPVNIFVYSAGISAVGPFAAGNLAHQHAVLDVNLRAPLQLTAGLLQAGQIAPGGSLVFIASLSVFTGYPGAAVYAASKDGLAAYARSLRVSLAPRGLHVLTVYPGPTRTAHARRYSPDNRHEHRRMPPERLAALIVAAVQRRDASLVPGNTNRLIAILGRLVPALTEEMMRTAIFARLLPGGTQGFPDVR